jgi:hypothetical protein
MIEETIKHIESRLQETGALTEGDRAELLKLLELLRAEVSELSKTSQEHARSIAGFAQVSAHEVTRKNRNQKLVDVSLEGLSSSVQGLENSHPRLVQIVNRIAVMLSNTGI